MGRFPQRKNITRIIRDRDNPGFTTGIMPDLHTLPLVANGRGMLAKLILTFNLKYLSGKALIFGAMGSLINQAATTLKFLSIDELVKSLKNRIFVIPVKTGIQDFQTVKIKMDSRLRGNDDFLRVHQALN